MKRRPQVVQRFGRASKRCLRSSGLGILKEEDVNFTDMDRVAWLLETLEGGMKGVPKVGVVDVAESRPEARN